MTNTNFAAKALDDSIKLSKIREYCRAIEEKIAENEVPDGDYWLEGFRDGELCAINDILKIIENEES